MCLRLHSNFCEKNYLSFGHGGNKPSSTPTDSLPFRAGSVSAGHAYPLTSWRVPELSFPYAHMSVHESTGLAAGQSTGRSKPLSGHASV